MGKGYLGLYPDYHFVFLKISYMAYLFNKHSVGASAAA